MGFVMTDVNPCVYCGLGIPYDKECPCYNARLNRANKGFRDSKSYIKVKLDDPDDLEEPIENLPHLLRGI